ncbi:MAG TPA: NADH-quinone oxidoreductase subunit M [Candidatus Acidoferrales bacterium]|nr:NADH-quinone oxidoreductase subunit M [Candidatus Acidoferrales bacterium]
MFLSNAHILGAVLFTPAVGAAVLLFLPRARARATRIIALGFGCLTILNALPLLWRFDPSSNLLFQCIADAEWIPSIGARYTLGIDGISLLLVMLTAVLGMAALAASWVEPGRERSRCALLLLLEFCLLGVFLSLDFVLFYFFWEMMLVPAYFLIVNRGEGPAARAGMKFFVYTLAGSVLMLLAIAAVWHSRQTFDMREVLAHPFGAADAWHAQKWIFWGFFLAFAIKLGLFPFHTWLLGAHAESPTEASLLLAGASLNMGLYGFLRVLLPMLPEATARYHVPIMILAVISIVYGGFLCLAQKDSKRLIACASIPQLGFCALGIFALTPLGIAGGVVQMISQGIVIAALFLIFDSLSARRGTPMIEGLRGAPRETPGLAAFYVLFTLAAIGVPVFSAFAGEFAIVRGLMERYSIFAACAAFGILLFAATLLWLYQRIAFGESPADLAPSPRPLGRPEWAVLLPLAALAIWIGVFPQPFFHAVEAPVKQLVAVVNPGYYVNRSALDRSGHGPATSVRASQSPPPSRTAVAKAVFGGR